MTIDDLCINKIIQNGVYYIPSNTDDKGDRPYIVVSKDFGYSLSILAYTITSKYSNKQFILPLEINGKCSFIACSELVTLNKQDVLRGNFVGVVSNPIMEIANTLFIQRIMNVNTDALHTSIENYCELLEEEHIPLYTDPNIYFTRSLIGIKNNNKKNNKINYTKQILNPNQYRGEDEEKFSL